MSVSLPTPKQVRELADEIGLSLTEDEITSLRGLMAPNVEAYNFIDAMPDNLPEVKYPRTPGYRPDA